MSNPFSVFGCLSADAAVSNNSSMFSRRACRRNCVFFCFLFVLFYGAYFFSRYEIAEEVHHHDNHASDHDGHHHDTEDEKKSAGGGDGVQKSPEIVRQSPEDLNRALMGNAFEPYTLPNEVDYETMSDILPHMWKHAVESPLPRSCEFLTFDHNPDMDTGESMFIYASLFGIARKSKRIPFIDHKLGFPLSQIFQFKFMIMAGKSIDGSFMKLRESHGCCKFDEGLWNISCGLPTILSGHLQSYRYFHQYSQELLSTEFLFRENVGKVCLKQFHDTISSLSKDCFLVGVHIRHADELSSRQKERGHLGADGEYLRRAFDYFRVKYAKSSCLAFLVTGREQAKNRQIVSNSMNDTMKSDDGRVRVLFVQAPSEAVALCTLTMCQHVVFTTGPTGWWAAYLTQQRNRGEVIYQERCAKENSLLERELRKSDYFLDSWKGL